MTTQISTTTATILPGPWPGAAQVNSSNSSRVLHESDHRDEAKGRRVDAYKHAFAVHSTDRISCLTPGHVPTPSFSGFRNLMVLVIVVSNLRLMIENFKKYGVLICLSCHDYRRQDIICGSILFSMVPCHLVVAYIIELVAAQEVRGAIGRAKRNENATSHELQSQKRNFTPTWHLIACAHGINATLNLVVASYVVYYKIHHPGIGTLCEMHATIVWLKV